MSHPTSIATESGIETDPSKIADSFNSYFSSIAEKLQEKIYPGNANFTKYLSTPLDHNFIFGAADSQEIIFLINGLDNSKAVSS